MDVDLATVAGEEAKHVRWRNALPSTTAAVAIVMSLVVNSDIVNGCKVVPDRINRQLLGNRYVIMSTSEK